GDLIAVRLLPLTKRLVEALRPLGRDTADRRLQIGKEQAQAPQRLLVADGRRAHRIKVCLVHRQRLLDRRLAQPRKASFELLFGVERELLLFWAKPSSN